MKRGFAAPKTITQKTFKADRTPFLFSVLQGTVNSHHLKNRMPIASEREKNLIFITAPLRYIYFPPEKYIWPLAFGHSPFTFLMSYPRIPYSQINLLWLDMIYN
jgi:hypothetical protein